ncbi:MAG TPA: hypothetical protein VF600_12720 [Abditibacteriaceae bacterium]
MFSTLPLASFFMLSRQPQARVAFLILSRRRRGRWLSMLDEASSISNVSTLWALPRQEVGDSPHLYHPLYLMAVLSAAPCVPDELRSQKPTLQQWPIPRIEWSSHEDVRRSMTLNGMRMSTEYWQSGSTRVLQLVESRLEAGQRDIVHDVLVYLMRQVLDIRAGAQEARDLRAESVAAFLGLQEPLVRVLFAQERLSVPRLSSAIESGIAGRVRRAIDVPAMLKNQLQQLRPQLREYSQREERWQWLIDEVAQRLYAAASTSSPLPASSDF